MSLFTRAIQRTNSMAVREPAVVASGLLMLIGLAAALASPLVWSSRHPDQPRYVTSSLSFADALPPSIVRLSVSSLCVNEDAVEFDDCIPIGALYTPLVETELHASPPLRRAPLACAACHAFINRHCQVDLTSGVWQCVICKKRNTSDQLVGDAALFPELSRSVCEYVDPASQPPPLVRINGAAAVDAVPLQPVLFVLDGTLDRASMQRLSDYVENALALLQPTVPVGLVVFSNTVSIYDLTMRDSVAAFAFAAAEPIVLAADDALAARFVRPLGECQSSLVDALHALVDAALPAELLLDSRSDRQRAVGAAVDVAVQLVEQLARLGDSLPSARGARIVVFTSGSPNFGPGSVDAPDFLHTPFASGRADSGVEGQVAIAGYYMSAVGRRAARNAARIDVLAFGVQLQRVPLYQHLAIQCGGRVLLHRAVDDQCADNLLALIAEREHSGVDGSIVVLSSAINALIATRIIGPAASFGSDSGGGGGGGGGDDGDGNDDAHDGGDDGNGTVAVLPSNSPACVCSCRMTAVRPDTCFAVYFDQIDVLPANSTVYWQFVSQHTARDNVRRIRIHTVALPMVASPADAVKTASADVIAILVAKREVLLARKEDHAAPALDRVEEWLRCVVTRCGRREVNSYVVPAALQRLLPLTYSLLNGGLLGALRLHDDDCDHVRGRLLAAAPRDALLLIEPALFVVESDVVLGQPVATLRRVAPCSLALWSNRVLVLDAGDSILLWCGINTGGRGSPLANAAMPLVQARAAVRMPRPYVAVTEEYDSMSRLVLCRLYALHKDSDAEQVEQFPDVAQLSPAERQALREKLFHTDAETLSAFARRIGGVQWKPSQHEKRASLAAVRQQQRNLGGGANRTARQR